MCFGARCSFTAVYPSPFRPSVGTWTSRSSAVIHFLRVRRRVYKHAYESRGEKNEAINCSIQFHRRWCDLSTAVVGRSLRPIAWVTTLPEAEEGTWTNDSSYTLPIIHWGGLARLCVCVRMDWYHTIFKCFSWFPCWPPHFHSWRLKFLMPNSCQTFRLSVVTWSLG